MDYSLRPQFEGRDREPQAGYPNVHAQDGGCLHLVGAGGDLQLEDVLHEVVLLLHLLKHPSDFTEIDDPFGSLLVGICLQRNDVSLSMATQKYQEGRGSGI